MKKIITITIALIATVAAVRAETATLYGKLTIIANQFVLKTDVPVETEDELAETGEIVSSNKVMIICTDEQRSELRKLVGKRVRMWGVLDTAHTLYHIEPILLDIQGDGEYSEE